MPQDQTIPFETQRLWMSAAGPAGGALVPALLGRGHASLQGTLRGYAAASSADILSQVQTTEMTTSLRLITSEAQLQQELRLHVGVSFASLEGSAGGSVDFYRRHDFSSYSLWLLAKVRIIKGGRQLNHYLLRPEALELAQQSRRHFYESYGDEFVDSVLYGGELNILISFNTSSEQELETLKVSVSGQCGGFSAVADLTQSMSQSLTGSSFELAMYASGHDGPLPDFNVGKSSTAAEKQANLQRLIDFINAFPAEIDQHTEDNILSYSTLPVQCCDNWPSGVHLDLREARYQIEDLAVLRRRGTLIQGSLEFVLEHTGQFIDPNKADLNAQSERLGHLLLLIDRAAEARMLYPLDPYEAQTFDFRAFEGILPVRRKLHRPAILAEYTTRLNPDIQRTAINITGAEEWIAQHGGSKAPLTSLMLRLDPPVYSSALRFRVLGNDNNSSPWVEEGQRYDIHPREIVRFTCEFSGAMAFAYRLEFRLHQSDIADSALFAGGENLQGDPGHGVESIHIALQPMIT